MVKTFKSQEGGNLDDLSIRNYLLKQSARIMKSFQQLILLTMHVQLVRAWDKRLEKGVSAIMQSTETELVSIVHSDGQWPLSQWDNLSLTEHYTSYDMFLTVRHYLLHHHGLKKTKSLHQIQTCRMDNV